jgi:hypothetical protein
VTECTQSELEFPALKRRKIEANFQGGDVTSNGGALLLRQADRSTGLTQAVADVLDDGRRQASCEHSLLTMLRQRVYGIALGDEDLNDQQALRDDLALQTAVDRTSRLASAPTLCRWENRADDKTAWLIHQVLVDQFGAGSLSTPGGRKMEKYISQTKVTARCANRFCCPPKQR